MKRYVIYLVKVLIFLLILFASMRIVFIFNYWHLVKIDMVPFVEILKGFFKALPLDIATACFILPIPAIVMFVCTCFNKNINYRWMRWYFYIIIALYILTVMGEIGIYDEWRTKLSAKALAYLREPSEVFNSASTKQTVLLISLWACFTLLFSWLYVKWIEPSKEEYVSRKDNIHVFITVFVVSFGLMFLGMRGGFGEIPISSSSGYFSNYKIVNVMTVNPAYNLLEDVGNSMKLNNVHFNYMDPKEAEQITEATHEVECDSTVMVLNTERPNVLIVLLESWSGDLIESLGGDPSITPNFHELEKDGLLFTNFYASANRSQQAIASIIGGLPGLPVTTITDHKDKYYAIPSIVKALDSAGYYSSFYFGGELNYGNILSYLRDNEFDRIVEGNDVDASFSKGKLGIQDTDMLPWAAKDISSQPEPFFTTIFTLSTHSPYDYPKGMFSELEWPQVEKVFVNSAKYTDVALKMFMEEAKKQPWYSNTIFLFMADHSHPSYKNYQLESFEYHKIPLLMYGDPLQDSLRGTTFDKICGNTDVPATILAQLGLHHDQFFWSKDVFNTCYRPFAFFELNGGLGWKTDEGEMVISNESHISRNTFPEELSDSLVRQGKAYMQYHFDLFNSY